MAREINIGKKQVDSPNTTKIFYNDYKKENGGIEAKKERVIIRANEIIWGNPIKYSELQSKKK